MVRVRRGKFGSRLLIKLAGIFALVGLLPGLTIYRCPTSSSRAASRLVRRAVAGALDAGLTLGRARSTRWSTTSGSKARVAAEKLGDDRGGAASTPLALERTRTARAARGPGGRRSLPQSARCCCRPAAAAGHCPTDPPRPCCARPACTGVASQLEGLDEDTGQRRRRRAGPRALARIPSRHRADGQRGPLPDGACSSVPRAVAANALAVQAAYREYQQRAWRATACAACTSAR
jgi:hypothetical protein